MARPAKDAATRRPVPVERKAPAPITSPETGGRCEMVQARSRANRPMNRAPIGVGSRTMRPLASQEASAEPMAMPTEKIASSRVTTVSEPFRLSRTSTGSRASTTAPTSQNQLTMSEPRHRRVSA